MYTRIHLKTQITVKFTFMKEPQLFIFSLDNYFENESI